jgi:hypothetical protein
MVPRYGIVMIDIHSTSPHTTIDSHSSDEAIEIAVLHIVAFKTNLSRVSYYRLLCLPSSIFVLIVALACGETNEKSLLFLKCWDIVMYTYTNLSKREQSTVIIVG